jgi:hypothetical protein
MAPQRASLRCSSKEDQVFQETKEETQNVHPHWSFVKFIIVQALFSKMKFHAKCNDQKAPQLPRTSILCRHKGWLFH